ncbi:MAG: hypothetical protein ACI85K_002007 [Hyphomicrobiaceae bacterium]|jgi:hypothetical protein
MKNLLVPLSLLLAAPILVAQCGPTPGVSQMQNGALFDGWTAATPVGFAFPFEGGTYTDVYITDHGMVALNNGGVPAVPAGGAAVWTPGAALLSVPGQNIIAPYWSDHVLTGGLGGGLGEIFVDNTSGTECTISWVDVETYNDVTAGAGAVFNVQLVLYISGEMEFRYDGRVTNDGSSYGALEAVVGIAPDGLATPAVDMTTVSVSLTSGCLEEFITTAAGIPNPLFDLGAKTLRFLPTSPGWVIIPGNSDCANHEMFGAGCDSLALDSNNPVLGTNWDLTTTGLSPISPIAITFFGNARVDPGLPLTVIGINSQGCSVHFSGFITSGDAAAVAGAATLSIPIPNVPAFVGSVLVAQSIGVTPAFPSLIATSNGLEGVIGY